MSKMYTYEIVRREYVPNEYEKSHNRYSYKAIVDSVISQRILCNEINDIFLDLEFITGVDYDDEDFEYPEIYQYYITDLADYDVEYIKERYSDELIIAYSNTIDKYILCVDHWGTGWDYVLTGVAIEDESEVEE